MRRDKTPHVLPVRINGYERFRVTYWTAEGRHREHYSSLQDAEKRIKELAGERKRFGEAAANMSAELRADAIAAAEILRGTGRTLVEAARALVEAKEKESTSKDLREAIGLFLASRDGRDAGYKSELKGKLEQFARFFDGRSVASIEIDDCQRFLDGIAGTHEPVTVANYRRALSMFFRHANLRKWSPTNPAALTAAVDAPITITILTVDEARRIMESCEDEIRPGVALQLFCGIRAAEIARLDWSAVRRNVVKEKRGTRTVQRTFYTVTVTVMTSKKKISRRVVEIPDNALTWIGSPEEKSGAIWPKKERARDLWTLARVRAGYGPFFTDFQPARDAQLDAKGRPRKDLREWPDNALRRSAISYHLAKTNDLGVVSYQAGNSPSVVRKHYNGLALPQEAAEFYAITRK